MLFLADKSKNDERNTENMMSDLCFNEESDYPEENTSDNENFCCTILQFVPEQRKNVW